MFTAEAIPYLISAVTLGLAAGVMPGPLTALVITETIMHNRRQGIIVASVPLLTDAPIVAAAIFIISRLAHADIMLGCISLAGAAFLSYLAYRSFSSHGLSIKDTAESPQSLKLGLITNFLSPNPYVFWMTVGSATLINAYRLDPWLALTWLVIFYFLLVVVKSVLAVVVDRFRAFMTSSAYLWILRFMGLALFLLAVKHLIEGLRLIGLLQDRI